MRKYHWKNQETRQLFQAMLALKTADEAERFFRDLCTLEEIDEMSRRWQAVQRLVKEQSYRDIADAVELSTSTVARVAHWLHSGTGGYQLILRRLGLSK